MLAFVLSLAPSPALFQGPAPIADLIGAYPRGDVLCSTTTADGKRTFVADGATLAVLDTENLAPELYPQNVLGWIEMCDVPAKPTLPLADDNADPTANAMMFHRGSTDQGSLFIAGGTAGMFRMDLSRGWLESGFPQTSTLRVLETPHTSKGQLGDPATHRWKRCVDVALVDQGSRKLVLGLFASSQRHGGNATFGGVELGASEVIAWEFTGDGPASYYGRFAFDSTTVVPTVPGADNIIATAIASDPGDSNHVYVGLGIEWLWRLDISSVSGGQFPGATRLALNPNHVPCEGRACPSGERLRDLAIVRRTVAGATQGLIYAIFEYGMLLEIEVPPANQAQATVLTFSLRPCGFGERVAAVTDGGGSVLVAVGLHPYDSWYTDTAAPYRPTGIWRDPCIVVGLGDPNQEGIQFPFQGNCGDDRSRIQVFRRTATGALNALALEGVDGSVELDAHGVVTDRFWGSLQLRYIGSNRYYLYEASSVGSWTLRRLQATGGIGGMSAMSGGTPAPRYVSRVAHYAGPALGAADGSAPLGDDTLAFFGGETMGPHPEEGLLMRAVQTGSVWDLVPVPNTVSVCASRTEALPSGRCDLGSFYGLQPIRDPAPFRGGVLGSASWVDPWEGASADDPQHPFRTWLLPGAHTFRLGGADGCSTPGTGPCYPNPCAPIVERWRHTWLPSFDGIPGLQDYSRSGFQLTLLDPLLPAGDLMDMRWSQFAAPSAPPPPDDRIQATDLLSSANDPRIEFVGVNQAPVPKLVHCVRNGSEVGYKVLSPRGLMQRFAETCSTSLPDDRGRGQELLLGPIGGSPDKPIYHELRTHIELEPNAPGAEPVCRLRASFRMNSVVPGSRLQSRPG